MTSRGKFWGGHWGARKKLGGAVAPPGTPLASPLGVKLACSVSCAGRMISAVSIVFQKNRADDQALLEFVV